MEIRLLCVGAASIFTVLAASPVFGQEGELWRGEALAAPCFACHGPGGESPGTMPSLDEPDETGKELMEFRSGEEDATIMGRIAKGYTKEEIGILDRYFRRFGQGEKR
jgi:sulfide dehydrogenase cytochrome subunit